MLKSFWLANKLAQSELWKSTPQWIKDLLTFAGLVVGGVYAAIWLVKWIAARRRLSEEIHRDAEHVNRRPEPIDPGNVVGLGDWRSIPTSESGPGAASSPGAGPITPEALISAVTATLNIGGRHGAEGLEKVRRLMKPWQSDLPVGIYLLAAGPIGLLIGIALIASAANPNAPYLLGPGWTIATFSVFGIAFGWLNCAMRTMIRFHGKDWIGRKARSSWFDWSQVSGVSCDDATFFGREGSLGALFIRCFDGTEDILRIESNAAPLPRSVRIPRMRDVHLSVVRTILEAQAQALVAKLKSDGTCDFGPVVSLNGQALVVKHQGDRISVPCAEIVGYRVDHDGIFVRLAPAENTAQWTRICAFGDVSNLHLLQAVLYLFAKSNGGGDALSPAV